MKYRIAYGKGDLTFTLPEDLTVDVVEPLHRRGHPDPKRLLAESLANPIDSPALSELVEPDSTVAIVFNDITRPTPNHLIVPAVVHVLRQAGVPDGNVTLFNATGTHRANTDAELRAMLTDEIVDTFRIVQNDCIDGSAFHSVGTTRGGTEVRLLREFLEQDVRVLTGFIEPHFFAGFSGAGKAVMPGLAALDTIMHNHRAVHLDDLRAGWGIRDGNPLWEDVRDAAALSKPSFLVNVTLNRNKEITAVFAGDWCTAHAQGCESVRRHAMVAVDEPYDIVVTGNSGYPLDLNLYQSVKGMSAAAQIVKDGGAIVLAAECWDGIPEHGSYGSLVAGAESLDAVLATTRAPDFRRRDMWQAHIHALVAQKAHVYVHSDGLTDEQILSMKLTPAADVSEAILERAARIGPGARVCVMPDGPQTIPYLRERG